MTTPVAGLVADGARVAGLAVGLRNGVSARMKAVPKLVKIRVGHKLASIP